MRIKRPTYLKRAVRAAVLRLLSWEALARALRPPTRLAARLAEKTRDRLEAVHRNLPQVRRLALERGETKAQTAARYYLELRDLVAQLPVQPKISVLVPVYKVEPAYLEEALLSVACQVYDRWELCIVDDCSGDPRLTRLISDFAASHPGKVKSAVNAVNGHISVTSNRCLELATGDYVALLDHDDRLYPNALAETVRYLNLQGEPDILYSDECTIDEDGNRVGAIYCKPDWAPFMHLTMNYTTHLSVYRRELLQRIGGFRRGFEGSQDHDLMLRAAEGTTKPVVHVPMNLYQWRAHRHSTANSSTAKPYAAIAGEKAVGEALARRGRPGSVTFNPETLQYRVRFALPVPPPLVSIVIPSKDCAALLRRCLESLVTLTAYPDYEVIVSDNGSTEAKTTDLYDEYRRRLGDRFRVLLKARPFNFGAQINDGVRAARGAYVLLLNNDTEITEPRWLDEMVSLAQFPEVGAVGAKLLFPSRLIQHGGVLLSTGGIAEHVGFLLDETHNLYWNILNTIRETTAVTAACLLIAKEKFWLVGGMDELFLTRAYGDVEFCLALRDRGLSNLYTPYATLLHHESATRGRSVEYFERFFLLTRRGQALAADPYGNLNLKPGPRFVIDPFYTSLDLDRRDFSLFLRTPAAEWRAASNRGRWP